MHQERVVGLGRPVRRFAGLGSDRERRSRRVREWLEIPRCGDGDPGEQVTGDELGHIGADGRTITVDCTSVADTVINESGTSHIEMKLSGRLQLNR